VPLLIVLCLQLCLDLGNLDEQLLEVVVVERELVDGAYHYPVGEVGKETNQASYLFRINLAYIKLDLTSEKVCLIWLYVRFCLS